jgi:HK97 family phage portal protein
MSILERMKAIIAQKAQTSVAKWQSSTMFVVSGGSKGEGKRQTFSPYAAAMSYRSWVYAAANLNAVAVASVPLCLYVRNRSTGTKLWKTKSPSRRTKAYLSGDRDQRPSNYVLRKAAEYGSDFEKVTDTHPILELLAKVNPYQNGYDATVLRVLYTELTGNAYIHPVLDPATKRPVQLWTMPSQFVEIVPGKENFIEAYLYGASREQRKIFAPDEVIHFKRPNPNDLYYGIGKVEAAWSAVQMNAAVHEMDLSFFENKARPDYLMTIRGDASHDEIERLEAQIDEKLRGSRRTGRFLTATADIDIKPLSFPPKDLAGRESIVEEIAAIFGVPVSMLKANDPNLASAQIGYSMWRESTILPMLRMDEEVLNQNLLPLFGIEDDAFLAYDNPVVEDRRLQLEEIRTAVSGGWMTVNEARAAEGMEPLDDEFADRALMNGQPLGGMAALPPAPAAPMAPEPTESVPVEPIAKAEVDDCVSSKIPKLIDEGYPQDQAIAIAYSMCSEGKSASEAAISLGLSTKAFDVDDVETKALGDIDTTPPKSVAENARRALEVRASKPESQRGMTAVGIARARDLSNRKPLSEDTIRRMLAYFERHEVDKQGSTWDDQGRGWQAWYGWGGDDGFAWSRRKVDEFDRERERNGKTISKNCGVGSEGFEQGNTCGGKEGSGGGSSSSESKPRSTRQPRQRKERLRDRIEGTQAETTKEVAKLDRKLSALKKERSATQAKLDALNTRSKADIDKRVAAAMDRIFGTDKPKQPTASRAIERSTAKLAELQSRVAEKQKAAIAARERTNKLRSDFVAKYGYDPIVGRKK